MHSHDYDLIVIGAGPAGLMWAREALRLNKQVLLIDQGHFEQPTYSSINVPWRDNPKIHLGGIGGTANAWQGQCIKLDESQFKMIFSMASDADYETYCAASSEVASLLGIKFGLNNYKFEKRARKELNLPNEIKVRHSYMPTKQDWREIFKRELSSFNLTQLEREVRTFRLEENRVKAIIFEDNTEMLVRNSAVVALCTNAVQAAKIVNSLKGNPNSPELTDNIRVFDHPWRTKYRLSSSQNKFVKRKIFSFHMNSKVKMKTKYKFEVIEKGVGIGVFELRPEFKGSLASKFLARGTQKLFGFSIIAPTYVDIWCQIAQSKAHLYGDAATMLDAMDPDDVNRLELLERVAVRTMQIAGFDSVSEIPNASIEQAYHTTGTIVFSSENNPQVFRYPGIANNTEDLYISGAAGFGNCSWVNPTFSILALASITAKTALQPTLEI